MGRLTELGLFVVRPQELTSKNRFRTRKSQFEEVRSRRSLRFPNVEGSCFLADTNVHGLTPSPIGLIYNLQSEFIIVGERQLDVFIFFEIKSTLNKIPASCYGVLRGKRNPQVTSISRLHSRSYGNIRIFLRNFDRRSNRRTGQSHDQRHGQCEKTLKHFLLDFKNNLPALALSILQSVLFWCNIVPFLSICLSLKFNFDIFSLFSINSLISLLSIALLNISLIFMFSNIKVLGIKYVASKINLLVTLKFLLSSILHISLILHSNFAVISLLIVFIPLIILLNNLVILCQFCKTKTIKALINKQQLLYLYKICNIIINNINEKIVLL